VKHEDFFFTSPRHAASFIAWMKGIGKTFNGIFEGQTTELLNEEYAAALYILTSSEGTWERSKGYVDKKGHGIQFDDLLANEHWSGGYVCLIQLAGNLFNAGYTQCSPVDLVTGLDDRNYQVAMTAFKMRRRAWPLDFFLPLAAKDVE
jgi:hypothetical protein